MIARIRDEVARGRQVYWVCPLVEDSAALDLQNATETHRQLCDALPGRMIGLLHGRMPAAEKTAVMSLFAGGQIAVLVATTVIEVGVDVPNASLMVVEHAERFGLSQLHQLRGRVGRGATASVCVLLYTRAAVGRGQGAPEGDARDQRRLRDLAPRPRDPRPGRVARRAPVGRGAAALRRPAAGRGAARSRRGGSPSGCSTTDPAAAERHVARWLGGRVALPERLKGLFPRA